MLQTKHAKNNFLVFMKKSYALLWALAAQLCMLGTSVAAQNTAIEVKLRTPLLGLWGMKIPERPQCVEYYNFKSDNQAVIHSDQERSYALYDYQVRLDDQSKLPALILQVKYDNNEVDCSGLQEDQSGELSQYFVAWRDVNRIEFCQDELGKTCFAALDRVLP